jgi:hypothetical protein
MNNLSGKNHQHHRPKHQRTETLRPLVQKYQYRQLPLPEPPPIADQDACLEQTYPDSGKEPCPAPYRENS